MTARLLFVTSSHASFTELDRELLAERYAVEVWYQPRLLHRPARALGALWRSDVVVGWWASRHTLVPITVAWLRRRPSLLIVGGFDIANEPEIGYGRQRGGLRRIVSRWVIHRAQRLATNSQYSRGELQRNVGVDPALVTVMYHGVPDRFGGDFVAATTPPDGDAAPLVLSVGVIDQVNLERKGLRAFVEAAALVPEASWVLAGRWADEQAVAALRERAGANVTLTGWLDQDALDALYARAAVYVQPSRHEGFGVSVAEAMLARCVPVVAHAGALPEVAGDSGVLLEDAHPATVAAGVRTALAGGAAGGTAARRRALEHFTVEGRRRALWTLVDELLTPAGREIAV